MSLINDALKKAQRQRTGDASPTSQPPIPGGGSPLARPAPSRSGSNPQLLLVGAGALIGLVIAGGAFFLLRNKPASETTPTVAVSPPRPETAPTTLADRLDSTATASTSPTVNAPKLPEPSFVVKTEPAVTPPASVSPAATATEVAAKPVTSSTATPTEPPAPSARMVDAVEALRVAGIRVGAGSDAKVLMNDRVFRVGDTVDHALGIKLTGATASSLTFRDASGATYTRNF